MACPSCFNPFGSEEQCNQCGYGPRIGPGPDIDCDQGPAEEQELTDDEKHFA